MVKVNSEDKAFFRAQMCYVKPLKKSTALRIPAQQPTPVAKKNIISKPAIFQFSDFIKEVVSGETKLFFSQSGLAEKILRELKQGKIPYTQALDLHGMTIVQARNALSTFLNFCEKNQQRCVCVIHGKGKLTTTPPVLKNHVNSWLQQYPGVLAFCSATPRDGGTGAVYILLKQ